MLPCDRRTPAFGGQVRVRRRLRSMLCHRVAYPISYRQLEEMMQERGVEVDHSTLNRWVVKYVPLLGEQFRERKRPVGSSWRMDETYVRIRAFGSICIARSTRPAPRWTSC